MEDTSEQIIAQQNLNKLVDDVLLYIFSFLTPTELASLFSISTNFKKLALDEKLWRAQLERQLFNWPVKNGNFYNQLVTNYKRTTTSMLHVYPYLHSFMEGNISEIMSSGLTLKILTETNKFGISLLDIINNKKQILLDNLYKIAINEFTDPKTKQVRINQNDGRNILHWATRFNQSDAEIERLLSLRCRIESSVWGFPLHIATFYGYTRLAQTWLAKGADPNLKTGAYTSTIDMENGEIRLRPKDKEELPDNISPINLALDNGHVDIVKILWDNEAQLDNESLCYATVSGNTESVKWVEKNCPSTVSSINDHFMKFTDEAGFPRFIGMAPLHLAATLGSEELVNYFLKDNDVNSETSSENDTPKGFTPLHLAAKYGLLNVAKLLLSRNPKIDITNPNNETALHLAVQGGFDEFVLELSSRGANQLIATKDNHWLAIHFAASKGRHKIFKHLLEKNPDLITAKTRQNETLLHLAAGSGSIEIAKLILSKNVIDVNDKTSGIYEKDLTPLFYAIRKGHKEITQLLIENGASLEIIAHSFDKKIITTLHYAACFGMLNVVQQLLTYHATVDKDAIGNLKPHHLAAINNHPNVLKLLIKAGAPINSKMVRLESFSYETLGIKNNRRSLLYSFPIDATWQAIHFTTYFGYEECTQLLIDAKANLNEMIGNDYVRLSYSHGIPLCLAAKQKHIAIVVALLKAGAKTRDDDQTNIIINMARTTKQYPIAFMLISNKGWIFKSELAKIGAELMKYAVDGRHWKWVRLLRNCEIKPILVLNTSGKITVDDFKKTQSHYSNHRSYFSFFPWFQSNVERHKVISELDNAKDNEKRFDIAKNFIQKNQDDELVQSLYETIPDLLVSGNQM